MSSTQHVPQPVSVQHNEVTNELRQHNALSSAISHLLGQIRKRGLKRTLRNGDLPLWQRGFPRRVSVGGDFLSVFCVVNIGLSEVS